MSHICVVTDKGLRAGASVRDWLPASDHRSKGRRKSVSKQTFSTHLCLSVTVFPDVSTHDATKIHSSVLDMGSLAAQLERVAETTQKGSKDSVTALTPAAISAADALDSMPIAAVVPA